MVITESVVTATLGVNLKKIRERKKMTQGELAEKTGLSLTFINKIENGKKWVSPDTIANLCTVLGVNPSLLFA